MKTKTMRIEAPLGVNETYQAKPANAENINNMMYDPMGEWKTCGGCWKTNRPSGGAFPTTSNMVRQSVESMHWFSTRNGARDFVIAEVTGDLNANNQYARLAYVDWRTGQDYCNLTDLSLQDSTRRSLTHRAYSQAPWQKTQYISNAGWLYIFNGVDEPLRFDGVSVERVGFQTTPSAPIVVGPRDGFKMHDMLYADICHDIPKFADPMQVGLGVSHQKDAEAVRPNDSAESNVSPTQLVQDRAWLYGYAYTWVNDLGEESPISPTKWVFGDNVTGKVGEPRVTSVAVTASNEDGIYAPTKSCTQVTIPKPPAEARGVRLYRTKNTYHKTMLVDDDAEGLDAGSIPYNMPAGPPKSNLYWHSNHAMGGELFIVDSKGDEELGSKYDRRSKGLFPTGAKFCASFKGTLFLGSRPDYPSRVYYSAPLKFGQWPKSNFFQVGDRDSGAITGMYATKNCVVVFKRKGIYLIKGDPVVGFNTETLTEDVGCIAPNAICEIPGPDLKSFAGKSLGLMFLTETGPHVLHGVMGQTGTPTSIEFIGKDISKTWEREVSKQQLMMAQAAVNYKDEEVWIQVPVGADSYPSKTIVYHYNVGAWSFRDGVPAVVFAPTQNTAQHFYFGGTVDSSSFPTDDNSGIYIYSHGDLGVGGAAITSEYTTAPHDFQKRTQAVHFEPHLVSYGRAVDVNIKKDRRVTFERETANSKKAVDSEYNAEVWGTAEWDTSKIWYDYNAVPVRFDLHNANQMKLSLKATSTKMSMVSYDLHILQRQLNPKKLDVNG